MNHVAGGSSDGSIMLQSVERLDLREGHWTYVVILATLPPSVACLPFRPVCHPREATWAPRLALMEGACALLAIPSQV